MKAIDPAQYRKPIDVPPKVAKCPICGAPIVVEEIWEWESESGKPVSISIDCTTEPDIDGIDWPEWHAGHWSMPYVDWLPVECKVLAWFQRNYRCI